MQTIDPTGEYFPGGQRVHVDDDTWPVALENLPASQLVHAGEPAAEENRPAAQVMQPDDPRGEYFPGGQRVHVDDDTWPVAPENRPASQLVHADEPAAGENCPAAQFEHDVEIEYFPAGHNEHVVAPSPENFPESQFAQLVALAELEYLPLEQRMHDVEVALYHPAEQSKHELEPELE
jgi:hypothetical protein